MNMPLTADADILSDALSSLTHATKGATTAAIGKTLSEDYINQRIADGKGKYISPDKQVDLSTCKAPDRAWILKNAHHDVIDCLEPVIWEFLNGTNETVDSVKSGSQFMVFDYETLTASTMSEDNCADYEWITRPVEEPTTATRVSAFMRFFTMILNFLTRLFNGEAIKDIFSK